MSGNTFHNNPAQNTEPDLSAASGQESASYTENITNRDVDGDGSVDVVHSIVDGQQQVNYLSTEGEVILTDIDTDGDNIFETSVTSDNVTDITTIDVDADGIADTVTYSDSGTGAVFQEDTLADDGRVYSSRMDLDGDGMTDVEMFDENLDGNFEKAGVDVDADGAVDGVYRDVTGDGEFEYVSIDSDGDGVLDTNLDAADYGATGSGVEGDSTDAL